MQNFKDQKADIEKLRKIYGSDVARKLVEDKKGDKLRDDLRDRAAYVYVTGQFPSHLRVTFTGMLRTMTQYFKHPVALDGRSGNLRLDAAAVEDLDLDNHPMVKEVRVKVSEGFKIQPSLGTGTRRGFSKIFMFKPAPNNTISSRITVQNNGAILRGWPSKQVN